MNESDTGGETIVDRAGDIEISKVDTDNDFETINEPEFFPVSEGKLITLYLLSFGLYGIYWFYKNWKLQQPRMDKKIFPMLRAVFSIFFTHSLFNRIDKRAENLEQKHKFNANWLATLFVAAVLVGNFVEPVSVGTNMADALSSNSIFIVSIIIFIFSAYPLAVVQATVNRINNDMLGYLNHKYSMWNYLLITLGVLFWLMLAMGLLADSMGLVPV